MQCPSSFGHVPHCHDIITVMLQTCIQVWRLAGGEAHRYKQIGTASVTVNFMATDEGQQHLLTAASDGSVTLWSVDSLLPVYKMKLAGPASIPTFFSKSRFYLYLDSDVKIFSIRNLYHSWMEGNSECTSLKQLSFGLILAGVRRWRNTLSTNHHWQGASTLITHKPPPFHLVTEFADSSVRILDGASTAPDKSAATTVPQLSAHNLLTACCSLPTGRLFTLLSNSHVHVWELHLKRPPTFVEAWTSLSREDCRSMAVLDGEVAEEGVAAALGLAGAEGGLGTLGRECSSGAPCALVSTSSSLHYGSPVFFA